MRSAKRTVCFFLVTFIVFGVFRSYGSAEEPKTDPAIDRLNEFAAMVMQEKTQQLGYPGNQDVQPTCR